MRCKKEPSAARLRRPVHNIIKAVLLSCILLSSCIMTSCGENEREDMPDSSKTYVAVITKSTTSQYWKTTRAGVNAAGAEYNLEISFDGPEKDYWYRLNVYDVYSRHNVSTVLAATAESSDKDNPAARIDPAAEMFGEAGEMLCFSGASVFMFLEMSR